MNTRREILSSLISLFVLRDTEYYSGILELTRMFDKNSDRICYVSLSKPSSELIKDFKRTGIDTGNITFVDCVAPNKSPNVVEVAFPRGLTELNDAVIKAASKRRFDVLLFDSLSMLELYKDRKKIEEFIHTLITKMRSSDTRTVFAVLEKDIKNELTGSLVMFMDKVVGKSFARKIDHFEICNELDELLERLFGHDTRIVISEHRKDVEPEVYIKHWREIMNTMVGSTNTEVQLASITKKHMGEYQ